MHIGAVSEDSDAHIEDRCKDEFLTVKIPNCIRGFFLLKQSVNSVFKGEICLTVILQKLTKLH